MRVGKGPRRNPKFFGRIGSHGTYRVHSLWNQSPIGQSCILGHITGPIEVIGDAKWLRNLGTNEATGMVKTPTELNQKPLLHQFHQFIVRPTVILQDIQEDLGR